MKLRLAMVAVWGLLGALLVPTPALAAFVTEPVITSASYDVDDDQVVVEWVAAESDAGEVNHVVSLDGAGPVSSENPAIFSSPAPGTYTVRLTATEIGGDGDSTQVTESVFVPEPEPDPDPPNPPGGVTAVADGQTVTVSWQAAVENGSPVTGYEITLAGATRSRNAAARQVVFNNVAPGSHTASVIAESDEGDSLAGTADVTVEVPVSIPGAPQGVSHTVDETSVTIRWDAPDVTGNNAATSYRVRLGNGDVQTVTGRSATFTDLVPGTFQYTVQSINSAGDGGSASGTFQIAAPVSPPGTPPNVSASVSGDSVTVRWGPSADNGSEIVRYRVTLVPSGGTTARTVGPNGRSVRFDDLPDGTYRVDVRAESAAHGNSGNGSAGFEIDHIRPPDRPGNVRASASNQTVTVTWDGAEPNNTPVTGYRVSIAGQTQQLTAGARSATFSNVTPGTHTASVVATSAVGESPAGTASTTSTFPLTSPSGPPRNVTVSVDGSNVGLSWAAPDVTANNAATSYVVTLSDGQTQTITGTGASFGGLAPGDYLFSVESRNDAGSGGSTDGSFSIRAVPSPPRDLTVDANGREITVTWTGSEFDGNSSITEYVVTLSDGDVVVVAADEPLVAEFANLELGEYSVTVVARNGVGDSGPAQSELVTTVRPFEPFETEDAFIAQQYQDFLGRAPDAAGLAHWKGVTANDRSNVDEVIEAFMKSEEFAPRRSIARLYLAFFDRAPDQGGFDYWAREIGASRATLDTVSESFVGSTEFQDTYGALSDAEFIALVYNNVLIRQPDQAGYAYWLAQMEAGLTRGELMTEFSESPEFVAATRPAVDVIVTYRGMLNRAPDSEGFRFWVVEIADDPDSLRALIKGFFFTPEYAGRVVPE